MWSLYLTWVYILSPLTLFHLETNPEPHPKPYSPILSPANVTISVILLFPMEKMCISVHILQSQLPYSKPHLETHPEPHPKPHSPILSPTNVIQFGDVVIPNGEDVQFCQCVHIFQSADAVVVQREIGEFGQLIQALDDLDVVE